MTIWYHLCAHVLSFIKCLSWTLIDSWLTLNFELAILTVLVTPKWVLYMYSHREVKFQFRGQLWVGWQLKTTMLCKICNSVRLSYLYKLLNLYKFHVCIGRTPLKEVFRNTQMPKMREKNWNRNAKGCKMSATVKWNLSASYRWDFLNNLYISFEQDLTVNLSLLHAQGWTWQTDNKPQGFGKGPPFRDYCQREFGKRAGGRKTKKPTNGCMYMHICKCARMI